MHRLIRTCLSAALSLAAAVVLAACTISSDTPLVASSEGATILPDSFTLYPYEDTDGGYKRTSDAPATFVRDGNQYVSRDIPDTKGAIAIRFVPAGADTYLLVATIPDEGGGAFYGFAHYAAPVLSIAMTPDTDTATAIDQARKAATGDDVAALNDLTIGGESGAVTLKSRAALDYLIKAYQAGRLPLDKLTVAFLAPDAKAATPSKIVPNGKGWTIVP